MRPIVLQEIRQFEVVQPQTAAPAWAHQYLGGKRFGTTNALLHLIDTAPRRVKHPPLRFDKGVAVDRLA